MNSAFLMINGLRGKMGTLVAKCALEAGFRILPVALTSSEDHSYDFLVGEEHITVTMIKYTQGMTESERTSAITLIKQELEACADLLVIAVDYTLPESALSNWDLYCQLSLPFVMGTTGFDHVELLSKTEARRTFAVIAPNMCKQIAVLQFMVESAAKQFPSSFAGYELKVTESHQKTKVDTSGTAKAMISQFGLLCNSELSLDKVKKIRSEPEQLAFGVPEGALNGHGFHTYDLSSKDGSAQFQFKHNVCGRLTYAQGTIDAVIFLMSKISSKSAKKTFDMIDVLKAGNLR